MKPTGFVEIEISDLKGLFNKFQDKLSKSTIIELDHYIHSIEIANELNRFNSRNIVTYTKISVSTQFLVGLKAEIEFLCKDS